MAILRRWWLAAGLAAACACTVLAQPKPRKPPAWEPQGLSGGGAMFAPAISPVDPRRMMVNCDMSAAYVTRDGGRTWRMIHHAQLGGNTRCRPAFHPIDPNTIFAASGWAGRLKVTHDGGDTWQDLGNLPEGLRGEIAVDALHPECLLAGVNEEVWRSTDGGQKWTHCAGPAGEAVGFCFGATPKAARRLWFAATRTGVWRSDDGGETWSEKTRGLPWRELRSFAGGFPAKGAAPGMLYCALTSKVVDGKLAGGIFASKDAGETWESAMGAGINQDTQPADSWAEAKLAEYHHVLAAPARPLTVWAFNANTGVKPPHHTAAWRSDDGGRTWRATFFPDPRFGGCNVEADYTVAGVGQFYQSVPEGAAICATNPDVVIQVDSGCAHVTADGGKTWTTGHAHAAAQQGFFECTGLVVTTTWHYYLDPFEPKRRYICYTDIGFARSLDAGATWHWWAEREQAPWRNTCYELAFDPETPGKLWGAFSNVHDIPNDNIISGRHKADGPGGVCVSTDFGATWTPSNGGLPEAPCTSLVLDRAGKAGARTLWAGVFGHGVFRSTDDGRTWTDRSRGLGSARDRRVCRVRLHADGTLFALVTALRDNGWVAEGPGLYRSRDQGGSWEWVNRSHPLLWPKDFTLDAKDSRVIYLGAADANREEQGGLWRTTDGGATWTRILRKGPQHFGAASSPHHPGWLYATLCEDAPAAGLWLSPDGGATWAAFEELPFKNIQRVEFDPREKDVIYVTTFGGSVWKGPASP